MSEIEEILTLASPCLPDYTQLGNRVFLCDGNKVNKVIMNANGDWRPMGAREQVAPLDVSFSESPSGGIHYGQQVTYGLRRVITANGIEVPGGLSVEYKQVPADQVSGGTSEYRKRITTRRTVDLSGVLTTTETVKTLNWDGSIDKTVNEYTGEQADETVGEIVVEEEPGLSSSMTVSVYEFHLPSSASVKYEIYRSIRGNTELLYRVAVLTSEEAALLPGGKYVDTLGDDDIKTNPTIDLANDGWDMTIPTCRYIRSWKGALVCGGSYAASIEVSGTASQSVISASPEFTVDDIGAFVSIPGEPYTYQILSVSSSGEAIIDGVLENSLDSVVSKRYRDDDVIYISRALSGNIEVYSAERGALLTNQGSGNSVTGIAANGIYAYIFRENSVEILTGDPASPQLEVHPYAPPGCRSHATISDIMSSFVLYYAGINGVWRLAGAQAERVSSAIDPILVHGVDHSQDEYCHAVFDPSSGIYYLFVFSKNWMQYGIRQPDMLLMFDTSTGFWSRGEMSASRSGLFKDTNGEMRPVIGTPGGIMVLGVGNTDGDNFVKGNVVSFTKNSVTLDVNIEASRCVVGQPIHVIGPNGVVVRRIIKSISENISEIYGEFPEGDYVGCECMIGAIRWKFTTPQVGLAGDFDRVAKVETIAIAHRRETEQRKVNVRASSMGELSPRVPDSQVWNGVVDFGDRSVSRIDGKATGLRGASFEMTVSGEESPALIKAVRIETQRVAR